MVETDPPWTAAAFVLLGIALVLSAAMIGPVTLISTPGDESGSDDAQWDAFEEEIENESGEMRTPDSEMANTWLSVLSDVRNPVVLSGLTFLAFVFGAVSLGVAVKIVNEGDTDG